MTINKQLLSRLLMLASVALALHVGCTSSNTQFCDSEDECERGQSCTGGLCETSLDAPDGALPLACNDENHACIASAPIGWTGPAIRVDQVPGAVAVCPSDFDGGQLIGFEGLQAGGSCGCSCSDTTDFTCINGGVEGRDGPISFEACFADCVAGSCVAQTLSPGSCSALSSSVRSQDVLRLNEGVVTSGTCGPGTISNNLEEPSFDAQVTLCVADLTPQTCQAGSSCAALPLPPFDQDMCIFQEGEHACPVDSIYQKRRVIFAGYEDQRSCTTCDCEPRDVGGTCGFVEVFDDGPSCSGTPINTNGICIAMPNLVAPRAEFTRRTSLACSATVDPPTSGSAVSVGATTVCCAR